MNVGTAHSVDNPNAWYFNSKGMWVTYIIVVIFIHLILLSLPFLSVPLAWTLTNTIHNLLMFSMLHIEKGTPFVTTDQAEARFMTVWEQIDEGAQFTSSKKFLTIVPIIMFLMASFYSKYDSYHFAFNAFSLMLVLLPKLPYFHGVRVMGINKY